MRDARTANGTASSGTLNRRLTFCLVTLLQVAPVFAQFTEFEAAIARFDADAAAVVRDDRGGCVSVAVFERNRVIWSKGYGWADIERRLPATAHTVGRIGSITKAFTAAVLMQLVERGIVELDDPVEDYLPEINGLDSPPPGSVPITFRMLASHTAGLGREPEPLADLASGSIYLWEEKVLASIPETSFEHAPGTDYLYSNIGFGILGLALSRAAGVPFMDLVTEQIFKPLGMKSSTFIVNTPELWTRLAVGYVPDGMGGFSSDTSTREHFGRGYKVPNGGIYSTVGDMAAFASALMGLSPVPILSTESREEMTRPQAPADGYGLGLSLTVINGVRYVHHGGAMAGYNADLVFEPDSGLGVAVLRTTTYGPPIVRLLEDLVRWRTVIPSDCPTVATGSESAGCCMALGGSEDARPMTISTRAEIHVERRLFNPNANGGFPVVVRELCTPVCESGGEFLVQSLYASATKRVVVKPRRPGLAPTSFPTPMTVAWALSVPVRQQVADASATKVSLMAISPGRVQASASLPAGQSVDEATPGRIPVKITLLERAKDGDIFDFDVHVTGACGRPVICPLR